MVGVNCSRYFTLKNPGTLLTIGRVQTATLGLVVARDQAIEGHVRQNYYEVVAELDVEGRKVDAVYAPKKDDPELEDGRILDRRYAGEKEKLIQSEPTRKVKVTRKEVMEPPPLPFNLTELQSYCSTRFGYDPTEVLNITQSLRDKHTAIIPQNKAVNLDDLTERERQVYLAICKYYMAQFLPPAKKARTSLTAPLSDGGILKASATEVLEPGWLALFKNDKAAGLKEEKSGPLATLAPGTYTAKTMGTRIEEKQTKPPARYTKASLSKDMTRIARYVTDPESKRLLLAKDRDKEGENGSIGTVATRGPIIDKLVERGYFREEGKKLISTPLGRELYRILPDELKKPDMTARWWAIQEDIQQGTLPWTTLPESVLESIRHVVATEYPRNSRFQLRIMLGFRLFSAAISPSSFSPWRTSRTIRVLYCAVYSLCPMVLCSFSAFLLAYHVHDLLHSRGLDPWDHYRIIAVESSCRAAAKKSCCSSSI